MIYDIELYSNEISVYHKDNLILKNYLSGFIYAKGDIFNDKNEKILEYYEIAFCFFFRIDIKENNTKFCIELIDNKSWYYKIKIENHIYEVKYAFLPFGKKCCKIFRNEKEIAIVDRVKWILPTKMKVTFLNEDKEIQYLALIVLLINLTNEYDI